MIPLVAVSANQNYLDSLTDSSIREMYTGHRLLYGAVRLDEYGENHIRIYPLHEFQRQVNTGSIDLDITNDYIKFVIY